MPLPKAIPRLTLFTGGKECSLCEVFKVELAQIRKTHPFELDLWNIRDPPSGSDERESKKWRRLYQYDIPVLHLGEKRILKHRVNRSLLEQTLEAWYQAHQEPNLEKQAQAAEQKDRSIRSNAPPPSSSFSPYRPILQNITPAKRPAKRRRIASPTSSDIHIDTDSEADSSGDQDSDAASSETPPTGDTRPDPPPWRLPLGRAFFMLNSEFDQVYGEAIPENEADEYANIIKSMFSGYSKEAVGRDIVPIGRSDQEMRLDDRREHVEAGIEIDITPIRGWVDKDVIYDTTNRVEETLPKVLSTPSRFACWNCQQPGHALRECPLPKNQSQIRASRRQFMHDRAVEETRMPASAQVYLDNYVCTEEDRRRRIDLNGQFTHGSISKALLDAHFWVEPEEEDLMGRDPDDEQVKLETKRRVEIEVEIKLKRKRKEYEWLQNMLKWGYPPGWTARANPWDEVARRISLDPSGTPSSDDSDDSDDDLLVFGGMGSPVSSSRPPKMTDTKSLSLSRPPPISSPPKQYPPSPISGPMRLVPLDPAPPYPPPSATTPPPPLHMPPSPPAEAFTPPPPPPGSPPPAPRSPRRLAWWEHPVHPGSPSSESRRWADYEVPYFDSSILAAYNPARPLPLGT